MQNAREVQYKDQKNQEALKYKLAAILATSAAGINFPLLLKNAKAFQPDRALHFLIKALGAGVILATGFLHILPDAFESLISPCLSENPWGSFPFAGFIAVLVATFGTLSMEAFAAGYYKREELRKSLPMDVDNEESNLANASHVHGVGIMLERSNSSNLLRHRVVSQARFKTKGIYHEHDVKALPIEGVLNSASAEF